MNDISQLRKFLVDLTKTTISIHRYRQKAKTEQQLTLKNQTKQKKLSGNYLFLSLLLYRWYKFIPWPYEQIIMQKLWYSVEGWCLNIIVQ